MNAEETSQVQQDPSVSTEQKSYEAPRLRREGKWNKITTQVISIPIEP